MISLSKAISEIVGSKTKYSDIAIVKTIYTRSECDRLKIPYSNYKHVLCDVQLVKDGSMLYDVKISPYLVQDSTIVADASDADSIKTSAVAPNGILIDVPAVDSYVFISYLNKNTAFIAVQSDADSSILGGTNGARLSQFVKDDKRILQLLSADEVNFKFPDNKYLTLTSDTVNNKVSLDMLFSFIQIIIKNGGLISMGEDSDGKQLITLSVPTDGRISIKNTDGISLVNILLDIISSLESYISNVNTAYAASAPIAPALPPPLIPISVTNELGTIKKNINKLLQ